MYADRVENGGRRSVKERLNGNGISGPTRHQQHRQITGKRSRQDDKWEHDLFDDDEPRITNRKVSTQDLRLKLQRKGLQPASQSGKSYAPKMRDLRERLSGTMTVQPTNVDPPKSKTAKPSSKSVGAEAPAAQIKRPADPASKRSRKRIEMWVGVLIGSSNLKRFGQTDLRGRGDELSSFHSRE